MHVTCTGVTTITTCGTSPDDVCSQYGGAVRPAACLHQTLPRSPVSINTADRRAPAILIDTTLRVTVDDIMASSSDDKAALKKRWVKLLRAEDVSGKCVEVSDLIRDLTWLLAKHTVPAELEEPIRMTLEGIRPDFKMFMSQFHGMIWGLGRYFDAANPDSPDFPGGLILDEQGTGKTAKAFLIATAIAMSQRGDDKPPVIILAKNEVISTWQEQAKRMFKKTQQIIFMDKHDRLKKVTLGDAISNSCIAVLPFNKVKDLDDKTVSYEDDDTYDTIYYIALWHAHEYASCRLPCLIRSPYSQMYPCVIVDEAHEFSVLSHSIRASRIFAMTATPKSSGKRSHSEMSGSDSDDAAGGSSTLHCVASGKDDLKLSRGPTTPFVAYNADMHHLTVKMCAGFLKSEREYTDFAADYSLITRVRAEKLPPLHFIVKHVELDSVSMALHDVIIKVGKSTTSKSAFNKVISSLYFMPWLLLKMPGRSSGSDMFIRQEGFDFLFFRDRAQSGCTMLSIKEQFDAEQFDAEHSLFDAVSKQNDAGMFVEVEHEAKPVYVGPYIKTLMDTIGDALKYHRKIVVYTDFIHEGECISYLLRNMKGATRVNFANARDKTSEVLESFQTDNVQLVILNKSTHGTGLNLQAATAVIMTAIDPDPKQDQQLVGRVHRPGQTNKVDWYHLNGRSAMESMWVANKQNKGEGCCEFFSKKAPTKMSMML